MGHAQKKEEFEQSSAFFDTLACVKRLKAAGIPEKQAEAEAEEFARLANEHLATKQDVSNIRKDLTHLASKTDLANTMWKTLAGIAIILALFKFVHGG